MSVDGIKAAIGKIFNYEHMSRDDLESIEYSEPQGSDGIMAHITKKLGLNGLPKQVNELSSGSTELHRNFGSEERLDQFLNDSDITYKKGSHHNFGTGIYAANDVKSADAISDYGSHGVVMGLPKSAKVVDYKDLMKAHSQFSLAMESEIVNGYKPAYRLDQIVNDPGRFAAILGYDAIKVSGQGMKGYENEYVVVNRGALEVIK